MEITGPLRTTLVVKTDQLIALEFGELSICITPTTCRVNSNIFQISSQKIWVTIDQEACMFAVGCGPSPGHKYLICDKLDSINLITNCASETIPFVSLNQSPQKFDDQRCVIPCFGTTIISKIPISSPFHQKLCKLQNMIKTSPISHYFGFTDPSSFHMTVFDLKRCESDQLELKITANKNQLNDILDDLQSQTFHMTVDKIEPTAFHIALTPDENIQSWRKKISSHAGILNNPSYVFHITLAYEVFRVAGPNEKVRKDLHSRLEIEMADWIGQNVDFGWAEFCKFDSMNNFVKVE